MPVSLLARDEKFPANTVRGPGPDLHGQRARGEVRLSVRPAGIGRLREGGSLKIRLPSGSSQAILINTAGGMAGGDSYSIDIAAEAGSRLSVTSQAAERVYRTLGPAARVESRHVVEDGARLCWMPQETILFNGSGLHRTLTADIGDHGTFLGLEATVLGRRESGEVIDHIDFRENWTIRRGGRLLHSERLKFSGQLPRRAALLGQAGAFATLLLVSPDAEGMLARLAESLGETAASSAWDGRLVIRLAEPDGFRLRKKLLSILPRLVPAEDMPRVWML